MSRYEWEHGTVTLPSGHAPKLKAQLRDAHNRVYDAALQCAKQWWRDNSTQSTGTYAQRLDASTQGRTYGFGVTTQLSARNLRLLPDANQNAAAEQAAYGICYGMLADVQHRNGKLRMAQTKDADWVMGPKATNRTTAFSVGLSGEATITFAGNDVTWDVTECNHASERAHAHHLAKTLFSYFDQLTRRQEWTSRSGGTITGNNDNNDSYEEGGRANYVVRTYSAKIAKDAAARRVASPAGFGRRW
jgi:hypothetical protein